MSTYKGSAVLGEELQRVRARAGTQDASELDRASCSRVKRSEEDQQLERVREERGRSEAEVREFYRVRRG